MRFKPASKISELLSDVQKLNPSSTYIAQTTTYNGVKGRYTGYDLGDGVSVGVFRNTNSNICRIITKGDASSKQKLVDSCKQLLVTAGFPEN